MHDEALHNLCKYLNLLKIVVGFVVKIPQIIKLLDKKSSKGIALKASLLDLFSYSVTALYSYSKGYSVLSYLEYAVVVVEQIIIIFLVLKYSHQLKGIWTWAGTVCYNMLLIACVSSLIPSSALGFIIPLCVPISGFSKIIHITTMIKSRRSEATSVFSITLHIFTNVVRIITLNLESGDIHLLNKCFLSLLLNVVHAGTTLFFHHYPQKTTKQVD